MVVGSNLLQRAEIYTDFLIQSDGFSRFLVRDVGLRDLQAGVEVGLAERAVLVRAHGGGEVEPLEMFAAR